MPQAAASAAPGQERPPVTDEDKALASDLLKRIEAAQKRHEEVFKGFDNNRKRLRGYEPSNSSSVKIRTNLYFSNLASMRPQVYAKDPEYAVKPSKGVPPGDIEKVQKFGATSEALLSKLLVKDAKLKKRVKRQLTSTYTTTVGWLKCAWQESRKTDPLITNRIKDIQDNLAKISGLEESIAEDRGDQDLKRAELEQTLAGLKVEAEAKRSVGVALDFVLSEDILILDESVQEVADYLRSDAMAHRVWMTPKKYQVEFGYEPKKTKTYTEKPGGGGMATANDKNRCLLAVWEVWDQTSNRVMTVCEGEEGFCKPPFSPDWTGERWYSFFLLVFNEVDGSFYPPSDVELIEPLVKEYNTNRDDLVRDRKGALPLNVVRKGGSLTNEDLEKIANRQGSDLVTVEGTPGQPLSNDIFSGALGTLNPINYDTSPARADIEQLLGGGDASRGTVTKAKTATEAEILSQGLRSRSGERQDEMEDMLSELGSYVLEMLLRKMTLPEVQEIAGVDAMWPQLSTDQIFKQVSVDVLGGSTGKPDRLQDQDRWTKLLPVIEKALEQVTQLRQNGGEQQAEAIIFLVKETLRRFEERLDIDQFLPEKKEGEVAGPPDPMQDPKVQQLVQQGKDVVQQLQEQVQQLTQQLSSKEGENAAKVQIAQVNAQRDVDVANVVAPIEAQAKVEAARVTAEAQAAAKVEAERQAAEIAAMMPAAPAQPVATSAPTDVNQPADKPDRIEQLLEIIASQQQQFQAFLLQLGSPAMQALPPPMPAPLGSEASPGVPPL